MHPPTISSWEVLVVVFVVLVLVLVVLGWTFFFGIYTRGKTWKGGLVVRGASPWWWFWWSWWWFWWSWGWF